MPSTRRSRTRLGLLALVVSVAASVAVPVATSAQDAEEQRDGVRERQAEIDLEIDALTAQSEEITRAIGDLQANVATQQAELAEAERVSVEAQEEVTAAETAVEETEAEIADLEVAADALVTEAFINGPTMSGLEALTADSLSDAAIQQALVAMQADRDADVLDQLDAAHEDLEAVQAEKEAAAEAAAAAREEAEAALGDLEAALAQQQAFATEVEDSLDRRLAEAESLRAMDAELSAQIEREAAERAAQLEALRQAEEARQEEAEGTSADVEPPPSSGGGSTIEEVGELSRVSCPNGNSITVAASIGENLRGLLDLAGQQGVDICGSGYRDSQRQIELRRQHCGTSDYAVYEMPSSQCSPPTARPGSSNHEVGLAVDFNCNGGGAIERGNSCWNFLEANANDFGFYNLPSEPWHWSVDGT